MYGTVREREREAFKIETRRIKKKIKNRTYITKPCLSRESLPFPPPSAPIDPPSYEEPIAKRDSDKFVVVKRRTELP